jgi:peptidoglycan/xylan/chitin deacetylase (PgdA/CDA1 family)
MSIHWQIKRILQDQKSFSAFTPILAYHHILSDDAPIDRSGYAIPASQFESQMRYLKEHEYCCMACMDLLHLPKPEELRRKKAFVLTFDDGFEDFYTQAYPILHRYGFTATVFLVTDQIGKKSNWTSEMGPQMLTWEQIHALSVEKFTFGSHTCTHACLLHMPEEQVRHELTDSKELLQARLGREIPLLAYPFGDSNDEIRRMAMQAGYQIAFGVITGEPGPFNLWRYEFTSKDSLQMFTIKLSPVYSFYIRLRGWVREDTVVGQYLRTVKHRHRQVFRNGHL